MAEAESMACAPTDGLGIAARATPCPPRARVVPLALDCVWCRCHLVGVAEAVSMAHALTDGLSLAAQAVPCPPPALVVPLA